MYGRKGLSGGARPIVWGLIIGAGGLFVLAVLVVALTALSYGGECGGLIPFMGEARECSLWEHMRIWLPFHFEMLVYSYWPFLAAILVLPVVILGVYYGYLLRQGKRR